MFLQKTIKRNSKLIEVAFNLHRNGIINPDTYVIDLDTLIRNAKAIKQEADKYKLKLYFMTKQLGRNPIICKDLVKLGYDGAVVVDFKEAELMINNNIKIGNIGHLVQIPNKMIRKVLISKPEYITVYSLEKAREINSICNELNLKQKVMIRVLDYNDSLYSGQYGGFFIEEIKDVMPELLKLKNIDVKGVTSFPCFLYDKNTNKINPTNNVRTLIKAKSILEEQFGLKICEVNMPSVTCVENMRLIKECGGTQGEPGHGLTGTTPYHKNNNGAEIQSMVYISEISHNLKKKSYCYGGGYYRRSHLTNAIVGKSIKDYKCAKVVPPSDESIDYYLELQDNFDVSDTVIMAFRTQIFVTRSKVAIVSGIQNGNPKVLGIFDSQGKKVTS